MTQTNTSVHCVGPEVTFIVTVLSHYVPTSLVLSSQRSREEYNENTEFTETERMMLMEANVDLEAQVLSAIVFSKQFLS